uniref:Putative bromodomain-containing protein 8 n=1 Tax=Lutzomyia longipalpis TaxID=7200 RepID=A0A1B0EVS1_LUTLO
MNLEERLQMKRIPLDKWSVREQLFLAAAVACSGENWMSVSRSLKMYCGSNRPSDWFSQKSCAAQYGKLLENVEMPKRKKRTASERDTPTSVDTPGESIYRKLTQERIQELKRQIQEDQKEFSRLKDDILFLHSASTDEGRIREMWAQIEQEKKQKEREQLQHQQWLKEREERKQEMEKAWRPGQLYATSSPSSSPRGSPLQPLIPLTNLKIKQEEMEVDDSASKQGTSPLLTSLLKSPSPAPNPQQVLVSSSPTSSRAAPTITNLLTGHQIHQSVTSTSLNTPELTTIQFQLMDSIVSTQATPSQAAPTLSMLLDNKTITKTTDSMANCPSSQSQIVPMAIEPKPEPMEIVPQNPPNVQAAAENIPEVKDEDQQLMDDFNGLIPDNIDELADILTDNNAIILSPELLEEESILENVDSLIGAATEVKPKVKEEVPEAPVEVKTEQDVIVISPGEEKPPAEEPPPKVEEVPAVSSQEEQQQDVKALDNENSSSNESKETEKSTQAAEAETIEIKSEPESSSDCEIRSDENSRPPQEVDAVNMATALDDSKSADGTKSGTDGENRSEEVKKDSSDSSNSAGVELEGHGRTDKD